MHCFDSLDDALQACFIQVIALSLTLNPINHGPKSINKPQAPSMWNL